MKDVRYSFSNFANLPTTYGDFRVQAVRDDKGVEHAVLVKGDVHEREFVPVRIHSECLTGDAFTSLKCDCNYQLNYALDYIGMLGFGVLIYLRQEGRGIGLFNKINAYFLQDQGRDTIEANHELGFHCDLRDYAIAVHIIKEMKLSSICPMTNNPNKIKYLLDHDISVARRIPVEPEENPYNSRYLTVKKNQLFHLF